MRSFFLTAAFYLVAFALPVLAASAQSDLDQSWNTFRGPNGNGVSSTATPPTSWSAKDGIKWKVPIPGKGSGSPIVWGDKVFVVSAVNTEPDSDAKPERMNRRQIFRKFDADGDGQLNETERAEATDFIREQRQKSLTVHRFVVYCFDRSSGKELWQKVAAERKPAGGHHPDHGYASASPVTDGERLFVSFGSVGIFCYDLDGNEIWKRTGFEPLVTRGGFGEGSSPALSGDALIVPWDHEGQSRIDRLDAATGETVWSIERDEPSNWATPRVVSVEGELQVIHAGENFTRGYLLKDGKELWRSSGLSSRPVSTPVVKGNIGFFASSRRGSVLAAFPLDKSGDISGQQLWKIERQTPDCPSLLLSENRLYYTSGNRGIFSCANADDGTEFYQAKRLPGIDGIYSSPVAAGGFVFITGRSGKTVVIKDDRNYEVVSRNDVGEPVDATLALAGDEIFIRGAKHLFCVQESD